MLAAAWFFLDWGWYKCCGVRLESELIDADALRGGCSEDFGTPFVADPLLLIQNIKSYSTSQVGLCTYSTVG